MSERPRSSGGSLRPEEHSLQALQQSWQEDEGAEPEAVSAQTQTAERADAAVQAGPPPPLPAAEQRAAVADPALARFLASALPRCEAALQQNELADVLADELAALADEEAGEAGAAMGGQPSASAAAASHLAPSRGSAAAAGLVEHHSFSDLVHSKGREVAMVAWHPTRRGVAAVACMSAGPQAAAAANGPGAAAQGQQPASSTATTGNTATAPATAATSGRATAAAPSTAALPATGCILIWSASDAVHPEAVLQAPADVLACAFHPTQPQWLAAGLATGQVALFNLQQASQQAQQQAGAAGSAANGTAPPPKLAGLRSDSTVAAAEAGGKAAAVLPLFLSLPDASHQAAVTDLHWLPGAAVNRDGRLEAAGATSAAPEAGTASTPREGIAAASSAAFVAAADSSCNLFATTAADGSLLLWDMRISARHQRKLAAGAKDDEQPGWKPALALAAASAARQPMPATRLCLDARSGAAPAAAAAAGRFLLGSLEGEVAAVDAACFHAEHKGAVEWSHNSSLLLAGHTGRVLALAFSPLLPATLLVVGDCGFVVWHCASGGRDSTAAAAAAGGSAADGGAGGSGGDAGGAVAGGEPAGPRTGGGPAAAVLVPLFESPFPPALYTCGCWSPTKPGTILLGRTDGRLEAWDLLDRMHQAVAVAHVAPCALTALAVMAPPSGAGGRGAGAQLVGVGDAAGTLRLLELPRALRRRGHAEARAVAALLDREQERVAEAARRAEQRAAEQRATAAAAAAAARRQQQEAALAAKEAPADAEDGQAGSAAERRYQELEARWRERLGGAAVAEVAAGPVE